MSRAARIVRLVIVVGLETGSTAWLLRLGHTPWMRIRWSELGTWLRRTPVEEAIAAFVWLAALGCAIWLTGSTLIYVGARASRVPALIRSVEWMALPAIRRVTESALGAILIATTVTVAPVRADPPPTVAVVADNDGTFLPPGLARTAPAGPEEDAGPAGSPGAPHPGSTRVTPAADGEASTEAVKVRSGDNLWVICRRHLTGALGRSPANDEIAPYWRRVIAHNNPNLISGNPDLIYPGEVIKLPPTG